MKRCPYPPDGGLKEQVRDFKDTFSIWDMIREHFGISDQLQLPLDTHVKPD